MKQKRDNEKHVRNNIILSTETATQYIHANDQEPLCQDTKRKIRHLTKPDFVIYLQIRKDPTQKYQKTINNLINNAKYTIQDTDVKHLKQIKPSPPIIKALPKIHEPNIPIRRLTNNTQTPYIKLPDI